MRFDSSFHLIGHNTYNPRTKHIALRFFNLTELVASNKILTDVAGTDNILADTCAKYLAKVKLTKALAQIIGYQE